MNIPSFIKRNFYFLIPILTAFLAAAMRLAAGPYWLSVNLDPPYLYLINSLYYFRGIASHFTNHPGTTLHMLFVSFFWLSHPGQGAEKIIEDVLRNPEFYLNIMNVFLVFLYTLTQAFLGWHAYRVSGSKIFAMFLQCPAFFYLTLTSHTANLVMPILVNINAEPLMVTWINLLFIQILKIYKNKNTRTSITDIVIVAIICSLGLATKFTFAPLIFFPLMLLKGWRNRGIFCISAIVSFLLFLLPIWGRYKQVIDWLVSVFLPLTSPVSAHEQFTSWGYYLTGCKWLLINQPLIIFLPLGILGGLLFLLRAGKPQTALQNYVWIGFGIILLDLLIVAIHPGPQYLVAAIGTIGIVTAFLYLAWREINLKQAISVGAISLILFVGFGTIATTTYGINLAKRTKQRIDFYNYVRTKYKDCKVINYYRSSGPEYALYFGDGTKNVRVLNSTLSKLYPDWYFFYIFEYKVATWDDEDLLSNIQAKSSCIIFKGTCGYSFGQGPYQTELVEKGPDECVNRLIKSTEDQALAYSVMAMISIQEKNYKKAYIAVKRALEYHIFPEHVKPQLEKICPHLEGKDIYQLCQ